MIGRTVLHYRVLSPLGSGGMGVVYLAEDSRLGRHVALKFLPASVSKQPSALERFRVEARAASSLSHPGICAIYDIGDDGDMPFIVMEALKGETLQDRIAKGALKVSETLDIGIQLADALEAAHSQGIVHRDIKPANIFLDEKNRLKVLDFGLAKLMTSSAGVTIEADTTFAQTLMANGEHMTIPGTALGTVAYMSPEQARGEEIDARTDLFSAGAVLYEMATGTRAFGGSSMAVVFEAILNRAPRAISQVSTLVPASLETVIVRALEKDRQLRYQHASDLQAELKRIRRDLDVASVLSSQQATPAVDSAPGRSQTGVHPIVGARRSRYGAVAAVIALIAAVAAGWVWLAPRSDGDNGEAQTALERTATPASVPVQPPDATGDLAALAATPVPARPAASAQGQNPAPPAPGQQRAQPASPVEEVRAPQLPPSAARVTPGPQDAIPSAAARTTPTAVPATTTTPRAAIGVADAPASPVPAGPPAAASTPPPVRAPVVPDAGAAATPAPKPAAPILPPATAPVETDEAAIRRLIQSYERAIETKDISLYRSIRRTLTPADEAVLRNSFQQVETHQVDIRVEGIRIDGRTATVRISRQDTIVSGGRRQSQNSAQALRFEKTDAGWVIAD